MPTQDELSRAVEAAIVAAAHAEAAEQVSSAVAACERLGTLGSARWRNAARDLSKLEEDLSRTFEQVSHDLADWAKRLAVPEEALWTVGEAASTYDTLAEAAMDELDEGGGAYKLLDGDLLFGTTFLEDAETDNRGTTLLFGWPDALQPTTWTWEANWLASSDGDDDGGEELDLYEVAAIDASEALLQAVEAELKVDRAGAVEALTEVAAALTRVSLLDTSGDLDEDEGGSGVTGASNGHV